MITHTLLEDSLSGLKYLEHLPESWSSTPPENRYMIILFHGKGSHEEDLWELRDELPKDALILSLRAPLVMGHKSFAWFFRKSEHAAAGDYKENEVWDAMHLVNDYIARMQKLYGVAPRSTTLIGFSQGGMTAFGVASLHPQLIARVVVMSGCLLTHVWSKAQKESLSHIDVCVVHGHQDSVVPVSMGKALVREVHPYVRSLESYFFNIEHEVTQESWSAVLQWINLDIQDSSDAKTGST